MSPIKKLILLIMAANPAFAAMAVPANSPQGGTTLRTQSSELQAAIPVRMPAAASTTPPPAARPARERKPVAQEDIMKQETIALGNNRFLIFSGTAGDHGQYGYSVDLVKIDNGIPRFDPLFIEEYNPDLNRAKLEYGVAFLCTSYHYDKAANRLNFTIDLDETHERLQLMYRLDVDILRLDEVVSQKTGPCPQAPCKPTAPRTIFKGNVNASAR